MKSSLQDTLSSVVMELTVGQQAEAPQDDACHGKLRPTKWDGVMDHLRQAWDPRATLQSLIPSLAPTPPPQHMAPLDGARALALLWVLGYHTVHGPCTRDVDMAKAIHGDSSSIVTRWLNSWVTQPSANGDAGVDMFFVLSGFLIGHFWLKEVLKTGSFRYGRFLGRRWLRLWPMLVVALAYQLVGSKLVGEQDMLDDCAKDWWKILLFVNNFTPGECMYHTWSVAVEFQFYLVSPFIMWAAFSPERKALRRWGLPFLIAASLFGVAANGVVMAIAGTSAFATYGGPPGPLTYTLPFTRCMPYVAGMLASIVVMLCKRQAAENKLQLPTTTAGKEGRQPGVITMTAASSTGGMSGTASVQPTTQQPQRCQWRGRLLLLLDMLAVVVACGLAYSGVGGNRWTQKVAPLFNQVLQVAGRWAFGWAVAGVFAAVLLGRLRLLNWFLSWDVFVPIATLSYGAYLLQKGPLALIPSWEVVGVTTLWAAWGTALLGFVLVALLSLLLALPCHVLVEKPCSLLWPRS